MNGDRITIAVKILRDDSERKVTIWDNGNGSVKMVSTVMPSVDVPVTRELIKFLQEALKQA